ncbi:MAG TPA: diguanylate cyclase [Candidatus Marinimicrobia bacterium]|nr:diguanylate cyclase [Candidatus Neomarinimicrobiota bacterium]HRS51106.1 diguanylate cyclase [Candidatus Neomarinimicrobiota bacterium]HRU92815.1 diguanylate cyclase [Candidatus Neomarinimicrobiota bacterium]
MKEWDQELFEEFVSQIEAISRGEYNPEPFNKFMRIGVPNSLRQLATILDNLFRRFETRELHLKEAIEALKSARSDLQELNTLLDTRVQERTQALEEANRRLESLSTTDALTGIYNRRHFDQELKREIARSKRYNSPLSLLMLDIDLFKIVNDTYGHLLGDEVLKAIGQILTNCLRKNDICARYGGEEFVVLLPETGEKEAFLVAEKIRATVAKREIAFEQSLARVTISIGIAQFNSTEMAEGTQLVDAADKALYQAKRSGRNKSVIFDYSVST